MKRTPSETALSEVNGFVQVGLGRIRICLKTLGIKKEDEQEKVKAKRKAEQAIPGQNKPLINREWRRAKKKR